MCVLELLVFLKKNPTDRGVTLSILGGTTNLKTISLDHVRIEKSNS